jgi:hypothetical protein
MASARKLQVRSANVRVSEERNRPFRLVTNDFPASSVTIAGMAVTNLKCTKRRKNVNSVGKSGGETRLSNPNPEKTGLRLSPSSDRAKQVQDD